MTDMVNQPPHYQQGKMETIEIIEALDLPYHLSSVVKYMARHKHKGRPLEDLKKAQWYLNKLIGVVENES